MLRGFVLLVLCSVLSSWAASIADSASWDAAQTVLGPMDYPVDSLNRDARELFLMGKLALEDGDAAKSLDYFRRARLTLRDSMGREAMFLSVYIVLVDFQMGNYEEAYVLGSKVKGILPPGPFRQNFEKIVLKARMRLEEQLPILAEKKRLQQDSLMRMKQREEFRRTDSLAKSQQLWNEYQAMVATYPASDVSLRVNPLHHIVSFAFLFDAVPSYGPEQMEAFRNWKSDDNDGSGWYWSLWGNWGETGIRTAQRNVAGVRLFPGELDRPWGFGMGFGTNAHARHGFQFEWTPEFYKVVLDCPDQGMDCGQWYSVKAFTAYELSPAVFSLKYQFRFPGAWHHLGLLAGVSGGLYGVLLDSFWKDHILQSSAFVDADGQDILQGFVPKGARVLTGGVTGGTYLDYQLILEVGGYF